MQTKKAITKTVAAPAVKDAEILTFSVTPEQHEKFKNFLDFYDAKTVDKELFAILVNAFNSPDSDVLSPMERANQLCLYKSLVGIVEIVLSSKN